MKQKEASVSGEKYIYALGRRKTSISSVRLYEGTGESTINGKKFAEFFPLAVDRNIVNKPLKAVDMLGKFYFTCKANGGGIKGIRDALSLAIARALVKFDVDLKKLLKDEGFLTRDDRMVERKHTGLRKARKRPQYSKR
jgi:small subunit ribosomal protein S9